MPKFIFAILICAGIIPVVYRSISVNILKINNDFADSDNFEPVNF